MNNWMKILLLSGLLYNTGVLAQEEQPEVTWAQKPIQCSSIQELVEMAKKYGESPIIVLEGNSGFPNGSKTNSRFVIASNPTTKTWTLMEFLIEHDQGCILGVGKGDINFTSPGTKT